MSARESYQKIKNRLIELFGRIYFQDVISLVLMVISLIILLSLFLILLFRVRNSDSLVPLSYNSTYGVISSIMWYKLYFLPFSFMIIFAANTLIAWAFFEKERLITYLILFTTVICGIFLLINEFNITQLIRG